MSEPPDSRTGEPTVLRGREHPELGTAAIAEPAPGLALLLSAGGRPKAYFHTDPNEDVVAARPGERSLLLVCADGHNGAEAAELAVDHVLAVLGPDPVADDLDDLRVCHLFWRAGEAVSAGLAGSESATTLIVCVLTGRRLVWAAMGDSSLLVGPAGGLIELGRRDGVYVGRPMAPNEIEENLARGVVDLGDGDWVVLATDGLADFVPEGELPKAVESVLSHGADAASAARALFDLAVDGGAGDNVGLVVVAPPGADRPNL